MAAVLLLLHWVLVSACHAAPLMLSSLHQGSPHGLPLSCCAAYSRTGGRVSSFLTAQAYRGPSPPDFAFSSPILWISPPTTFPPRGPPSGTLLLACRPRPKKEKALRNYRIAKQQQQSREERMAQRRQQLEVFKAQQQLVSFSEANGSHKNSEETARGTSRDGIFATHGASIAVEEAAAGLPPGLRGHLAARINYRLVGGTWRRAKGTGRFIRLPGAQIATGVFCGLPAEEVSTAVAKAKRQDAGQMDLEAYDESDTQHTTLEGVS